jgi:hypothetical protein
MTPEQLARIMAQIAGDRDGVRYTVRYETEVASNAPES